MLRDLQGVVSTSFIRWPIVVTTCSEICKSARRSITGLFVCLVGFLTSSSTTRLYRGRAPRQERLTILRAATHETELGDYDFCLSRSHYTDTDPTCRERAATAGIEPGTSSPGVARSTAELPRPPSITGVSEGFVTVGFKVTLCEHWLCNSICKNSSKMPYGCESFDLLVVFSGGRKAHSSESMLGRLGFQQYCAVSINKSAF